MAVPKQRQSSAAKAVNKKTYEGDVYEAVNKKTYEGGEVYDGGWNKDGLKEGHGKLKFNDGINYEGGFVDGFFSGVGMITYPDGSKYEGEFLKGKYSGSGTYTRADGMKFEGWFEEGKVSGSGLITFTNGTHGRPRCEGYFEGNRIVKREICKDIVKKARQKTKEAQKTTSEKSDVIKTTSDVIKTTSEIKNTKEAHKPGESQKTEKSAAGQREKSKYQKTKK